MNKNTSAALMLLGGLLAAAPAQAQVLPCREFNTVVTIGGVRQPAWGTGCLQPDGTWRLVAEAPRPAYRSGHVAAYARPQPVYIVEERPVVVHRYVERPRPRTSLSLGYSSGHHWGRRHHGWGTGVGVGFGPYW